MRSNRRLFWLLPLFAWCACLACSGTETGNPPTRNACATVVCNPCAPPIVLRVSDAESGGPVENLAVDGETEPCSADAADPHCQLDGPPYTTPGLHRIELSAPGYETLSVDVEVMPSSPDLCCNCGYIPAQLEVTLPPLSGSGSD